jgi:hypothetical protein
MRLWLNVEFKFMGDSKIGLTLNSTIEKSKAFFLKSFGLKIIDLAWHV